MNSNDFSQNNAYYIQYSGTPTQGHEDFLQSITSPENIPKPHINPNFKSQAKPSVHINPKFHHCPQETKQTIAINPHFSTSSRPTSVQSSSRPPSVHINPKFKPSPPVSPNKDKLNSVHVNPKFANRPLPSVPVYQNILELTHSAPVSIPAPVPAPVPAQVLVPTILPVSTTEPIYANVNPRMALDQRKTDEFMQSIHKSVETQVIMRNKFKKDNRVAPPEKPVRHSIVEKPNRYSVVEKPNRYSIVEKPNRYSVVEKPKRNSVYVVDNISTLPHNFATPLRKTEEKENLPSSSKKNFLFTPLRKTAFKKIGSRKLIRVKKKSLSPGTPKPSFKRIGNNKLIRIRESLTSDKSTPMKVYAIKTKTKIVKSVKNTPTNNSKYRFSFITPLSIRKNKLVSQAFSAKSKSPVVKKSSFANPFRLDRREKKGKQLARKTSQTKLKKLSTGTYHVSATKLQRVGLERSSTRTRSVNIYRPKAAAINPNIAPNKVITLQGVKFAVAENGRKLKRVSESDSQSANYNASVSHTSPGQSQTTSPGCNTSPGVQSSSGGRSPALLNGSPVKHKLQPSPVKGSPRQFQVKKTYIGGEEFDEIEPGVFTRSRHSLTRQSITQAKNRSINTILKVQNRSKQYCMFYNKFGKCTKKEKGSCPYMHDPEKIAVCRRFLQGACTKERCLLSHKLDPEKMPACKFFLEGICTRENCPYLHVKVSDKAGVCQRFLKGFCPNGADCDQRHVIACPEFDRTGSCSKDSKCPFPHISKPVDNGENKPKKKPPTKPKRKSLGTAEHSTKKVRVTTRYYDDQCEDEAGGDNLPQELTCDELEEKRARILKKLETAKQVWKSARSNLESSVNPELNPNPDISLNDSGPYEKIAETSEDEAPRTRAPVGNLGDFISLAGYSSGEENNQDRLI